jgi:hypothetical protein
LQRENVNGENGIATADWMSHVPDRYQLNWLNIPGTHESLALHRDECEVQDNYQDVIRDLEDPRRDPVGLGLTRRKWASPWCQSRPPYMQLLAGVRVLDCRFDIHYGNLTAFHGGLHFGIVFGANMGYSFGAVLQSVLVFLEQHHGETVILSICDDPGETSSQRKNAVYEAMMKDLRVVPGDKLYLPSKRINELTLAQDAPGAPSVRGRIILVHKNSLYDGPGAYTRSRDDFWLGADSSKNFVEDNSGSTDAWNGFPKRATKQLTDAVVNHDPQAVYRTDWNFGNLPTAPVETAIAVMKYFGDMYRHDVCGEDGNKDKFGIVNFDFYEVYPDTMWTIITSNKDCGGLQRWVERGDHSRL